jgi:hypothetical protein
MVKDKEAQKTAESDRLKAEREQHIQNLKTDYDAAIAARDKPRMLLAGRAYYSTLRGGELTIYDEQAIANDLNAIS